MVKFRNILSLLFSSAAQVPRLNFEPTAEFPALQYFGELEAGGQADLIGIKAGDFILEVSIRFSLLQLYASLLPNVCKTREVWVPAVAGSLCYSRSASLHSSFRIGHKLWLCVPEIDLRKRHRPSRVMLQKPVTPVVMGP